MDKLYYVDHAKNKLLWVHNLSKVKKKKKTIMHAYCSQLSPKAYTLNAFFIVAQGVGVFLCV